MDAKSWRFSIATIIIVIFDTGVSGQILRPLENDRVKFVVECEPARDDGTPARLVNVRVQPSLGSLIPRPLDSLVAPSNVQSAQPVDNSNVGGGANFQNEPLLPNLPLPPPLPPPVGFGDIPGIASLLLGSIPLAPNGDNFGTRIRETLGNLTLDNSRLPVIGRSGDREERRRIPSDSENSFREIVNPLSRSDNVADQQNILDRLKERLSSIKPGDQVSSANTENQNLLEKLRSGIPSVGDLRDPLGRQDESTSSRERGNPLRSRITPDSENSFREIVSPLGRSDNAADQQNILQRLFPNITSIAEIRERLKSGDQISSATNEDQNLREKLRSGIPSVGDLRERISSIGRPTDSTTEQNNENGNLLDKIRSGIPSIAELREQIGSVRSNDPAVNGQNNENQRIRAGIPAIDYLKERINSLRSGDSSSLPAASERDDENRNILERLLDGLPSIDGLKERVGALGRPSDSMTSSTDENQNLLDRLRSGLPSVDQLRERVSSLGRPSDSTASSTDENKNLLDRLRTGLPSVDELRERVSSLGRPSDSMTSSTDENQNLLDRLQSGLLSIDELKERIGSLGRSSDTMTSSTDENQNLLDRLRSGLPFIDELKERVNFLGRPSDSMTFSTNDNQNLLDRLKARIPSTDLINSLSRANDLLPSATINDQIRGPQDIVRKIQENFSSLPRQSEDIAAPLPSVLNPSNPAITRNNLLSMGKAADGIMRDVSGAVGNALDTFRKTAVGLQKSLNFGRTNLPNLANAGIGLNRLSAVDQIAPIVSDAREALDNTVEETQTCDLCNCLMKYVPRDVENGRFIMGGVNGLPKLNRLPTRQIPNESGDHMMMENAIHPTYVLPPKNMQSEQYNLDNGSSADKLREFVNTIEMEHGIQKLVEFVNIIDQVDEFISVKTRHFLKKLSTFYDDDEVLLEAETKLGNYTESVHEGK